jgi:hypothetical protein
VILRAARRAGAVFILLARPRMIRNGTHTTKRSGRILRDAHRGRAWSRAAVASLVTTVSVVATPLHAQEEWTPRPHVRPERDVRSLVEEAARRSPLIRDLIAQLERLDVIVYIRARPFVTTGLDGRIAFLSAAGGGRYLIIELACGRSGVTQIATLGHELYHAIEIAQEPSVVSAGTLGDLYQRIGQQTGSDGGRRTFETDAATAVGQRVRRQLLAGTRHGNGT